MGNGVQGLQTFSWLQPECLAVLAVSFVRLVTFCTALSYISDLSLPLLCFYEIQALIPDTE
jgi:hypothetical protein